MITLDWPGTLKVASMEWGHMKAGVQFASPYNGTPQAIDFVAERFLLSISLVPVKRALSGEVEGFFGLLTGGVNRVNLWHMGREAPVGTLRGAPTVTTTAVRGDYTIAITTGAGKTVKAGDLFAAGGQLLQAALGATADGSGHMVVQLVHRVRATIAAGTAVVWDKPTATFALPAFTSRYAHLPVILAGGTFDLVEVW